MTFGAAAAVAALFLSIRVATNNRDNALPLLVLKTALLLRRGRFTCFTCLLSFFVDSHRCGDDFHHLRTLIHWRAVVLGAMQKFECLREEGDEPWVGGEGCAGGVGG